MLKLADSVNVTNILHWFAKTGQTNIRDSQGPDRGWFECANLRNAVLDLARLVEAVEIGNVVLRKEDFVDASQSLVIDPPPRDFTKYVLLLAGGLVQNERYQEFAPQSLWLVEGVEPAFGISGAAAIWLEIELRLDY